MMKIKEKSPHKTLSNYYWVEKSESQIYSVGDDGVFKQLPANTRGTQQLFSVE